MAPYDKYTHRTDGHAGWGPGWRHGFGAGWRHGLAVYLLPVRHGLAVLEARPVGPPRWRNHLITR